MPPTQSSKLLPSLFQGVRENQPLRVLDVGPALADSVDFFADYRCKLHFIDLFAELPIQADFEGPSLQQQFVQLLRLQGDTRFDICLFWDLFNYLDDAAIGVFLDTLRPYLHQKTLAHGFSVHNTKTPRVNQAYGIQGVDTLSLRQRPAPLPGYAPHSQRQLQGLLSCFNIERSVLLSDGRLELLMRAKL